jgi:nucleoside-diphosphate-sugar epimerase
MKILITGGMGFIGSNLAEYLFKRNFEVSIYDKYGAEKYFDFNPSTHFNRIIGDVRNFSKLYNAAKNHKIIIHLAGVLGTDYLVRHLRLAVTTNIIGTLNVLKVARDLKSKLLYFSLLPKWKNPYMITKNTGEDFCHFFIKEYGLKCTILKAVHIYGKRQKWKPAHKAISNFIVSALSNKPIIIYGNGNQIMDLLYIDDAIRGIYLAITNENLYGKSIEFGSGKKNRVIDIAKKIISLSGSSSKINLGKFRPGETFQADEYRIADIEQQKKFINFKAKLDLDVGLRETIEWYRNNLKGDRNG